MLNFKHMKNNVTRIKDRYLVAWLRYQSIEYIETELKDGRIVWFIFETTEELEKTILDYQNKKSFEIVPFVLIKEIDSVTDIIYQIKNQYGRA